MSTLPTMVATPRPEGAPVRVLVVDDSLLARELLTSILGADGSIEVLGAAVSAAEARDMIRRLHPDVLTLDVDMPGTDGITFLRSMMRLHPMPVVMVSSLTRAGAEVTLDALESGAVDCVAKPRADVANAMRDYAAEVCRKVKAAAHARVRPLIEPPRAVPAASTAPLPAAVAGKRLLAFGASTGGTEALRAILAELPADTPPVVIAQHIPKAFSGAFAARLDTISAMRVREARDGDALLPGHAFVAPGDHHLLVVRRPGGWCCELHDGEPVNYSKPSVDLLFRSVASSAGADAVGVLLTGMGCDGAAGLLELRRAGAPTIAQDEKSSVVWGMPGAAVRCDAAGEVLALERIAPSLRQRLRMAAGV